MLLGKTAVTIASLQRTVLGQTLRKSKSSSWVGSALDKQPSTCEDQKHFFQSHSCPYLSLLSVHADAPGPPQPPFDISDIDADACSLSWHIPLEDGGSNITNYIVEKCDVSRGDWVTALASVTKTSCRVGKLIPGQEYIFRVCAENRFGISEPLTSPKMVAKFPFGMFLLGRKTELFSFSSVT